MNVYLIFFYVLLSIHHTVSGYYSQFVMDVSKAEMQDIRNLETFRFRYLTLWNMMVQFFYIMFALYTELKPSSKNEKIKGFLYVSIVMPLCLVVFGSFWTIYLIDRDLIYPEAFDEYIPKWFNHSVHTCIIILPIVEMFTKKTLPEWKWAFLGLSVFFWMYQITFIYTYFQSAVWLYRIYGALTWPKRICYFAFNYLLSIGYMQIAWFLHNKINCNVQRKKLEKTS